MASPTSRTPSSSASDLDVSERLWPSPGWAFVFLVFALTFGIILVPLGRSWVALGMSLGLLGVGVLVVASTPRVAVVDGVLYAGRARIGVEHLGTPEVLDRTRWNDEMGPDFDVRAFHCTRGWVRQGIRVPIDDPADPTTAWVISSRHPEALCTAISGQRAVRADR